MATAIRSARIAQWDVGFGAGWDAGLCAAGRDAGLWDAGFGVVGLGAAGWDAVGAAGRDAGLWDAGLWDAGWDVGCAIWWREVQDAGWGYV